MTKKINLTPLLTSQLSALPVEFAQQLQTASGAKALAENLQEQANDANESERHLFRRRADAARQIAAHLLYVEKVRDIDKAIARDKVASAQEIEVCRIELADAVKIKNDCMTCSESIATKVEDIQAAVAAQEQKLKDDVQIARDAFDNVMKGDDDDAQRMAAEHLSQAETVLHLAKQSSPDVLRLQGFTLRAAQATEAAVVAAEKVEDAQEALNQAVLKGTLIDLDASSNQLLLDRALTLNALANCKKRPFLNGLESIILWFSTGSRFANPAVQMSDAAVVVGQGSLNPPALALRSPDLSVFADK